jgi:heme exporter protein D
MNWQDFFHMGGYAVYVWTSYALTLAVLLFNVVMPLLQRRRLFALLARKRRRAARN